MSVKKEREDKEFQKEKSMRVNKYCGYGSCDNSPGHTGGHRCRCGKLVDVESPGCAWHPRPPKPMSTSILKAYLEFAADGRPLENQPVMFQGREIVNARIIDGRIDLQTWPEYLEMMRVDKDGGQ